MDLYRRKGEVQATQFTGSLSGQPGSALNIIDSMKVRGLYIPRGYESDWRLKHELDRSTGHTLDDASPFLLVWNHDGKVLRCSIGDWVVIDEAQIFVYPDVDFGLSFQRVEDPF